MQAEAARYPQDGEMSALIDLAIEASRAALRGWADASLRVLCPRFRVGDQLVRTISVTAQFGAPLDVTLDELRIELIYPADEAAERFFLENRAV